MITTTSFIERSKYIHKATKEAAIEVASNLREDDRREIVEGHGLDPMVLLPESINDGIVRGRSSWIYSKKLSFYPPQL